MIQMMMTAFLQAVEVTAGARRVSSETNHPRAEEEIRRETRRQDRIRDLTDRLADRDRRPTAPPLETLPSAPPIYSEDVPSYNQVVPIEEVGEKADLPPPTYFEAIHKAEETKY